MKLEFCALASKAQNSSFTAKLSSPRLRPENIYGNSKFIYGILKKDDPNFILKKASL